MQDTTANHDLLDQDRDIPVHFDEASEQFFGAPRRPVAGVLTSAVRHPFLVILPVVLMIAAATVVGIHRSPNYTAHTRMQVIGLNLGSPGGLSSYSTASAALATTYARAIDADQVVNPIAAKLHMTPNGVRKALSASPVAQSPVFDVIAETRNQKQTTTLANEGATALSKYAASLAAYTPRDQAIYNRFRDAAAQLAAAQMRLRSVNAHYDANPSHPESLRLAVQRATTDVQTAELRASSFKAAYNLNQEQHASASGVQVLATARTATSDRISRLQVFLFGGLVAGVLAGLALATIRENRPIRRLRAR